MKDIFGDDESGAKKGDFASMFEASLDPLGRKFEKGQKVSAEILSIGKEEVYVSVDGKDGVVLKRDLDENAAATDLKAGDKLNLYIVKPNSDVMILSARVSSRALSESLEDAADMETPVEGTVTEVVNGGFRVQVMGKSAFCPMSQMDNRQISAPEEYIGRKLEFMVTKFESGGRNVVVSRRRLLDAEKLELEGSFLDSAKTGETVSGQVTRFETFGAFIKMENGLEGLCHISEVSWSHIKSPSEVLALGQTVQAKILKIEEDEKSRLRISLSIKQGQPDPMIEMLAQLQTGQIFKGVIKQKERFGFFIEIQPGVRGLLPRSALKEHADEREIEKLNPGDTLPVVVDRVDTVAKRISLALPKGDEDTSWQGFSGAAQGIGTLGDQFKSLFKK